MQPMPLWPVMMYDFQWAEHDRYQEDLKRVCRDLESRNHVSGVAPNAKRGLYESKFDFITQPDPAVEAWGIWVKQCVFQAAHNACGSAWPTGINIAVNVHESWCHITRNGGYHDVHIHPNSSWSVIYYLDCGDMEADTKNGLNRFIRPYNSNYTDAGTAWMTGNTTIDINAEPGMLIVFPSWIQHSALPYFGERERYVLSLNCQLQLVK